jgi:ATP-dependent DNA helicase RecG
MTPERLKKLLAQGQGLTIAFKSSKDTISPSVYETVCAFANSCGGHIILGADDEGRVHGVDPARVAQMQEQFVNALINPQKIYPLMILRLEKFEVNGKTLLYVYVPASSQVKWCGERLFERIDGADIDVSGTDRAEALFYLKSGQYTERKLFPGVTENDLRLDLTPKIRNMTLLQSDNHPWSTMSDLGILKSAGLYEKDYKTGVFSFNLAAILLLGKDEVIRSCAPGYVTEAMVKIENSNRYRDRLSVRTNLIESYSILMDYIARRTMDRFFLIGIQRVSVMGHIAHGLVSNSLAHREYSSAVPAKIVLEKDCISSENWNCPRLKGTLDIEEYTPEPKNPLIWQFFVNTGLSGAFGPGLPKLYYYTDIYSEGRSKPLLTEGEMFTTEIPIQATGIGVTEDVLLNEWDEPINAQNVHLSGRIKEPNAPLNDPITEPDGPLNDAASRVLHIMKEHPAITIEEIAEKIGKTRRTVQRIVKNLKDIGRVKRIGSRSGSRIESGIGTGKGTGKDIRKTGHWEIT